MGFKPQKRKILVAQARLVGLDNKRGRNGSGKVKAAEEGRIFDSWRLQLDFFPFINRCRHRFLSRLTSQYPFLRLPLPLGALSRFIPFNPFLLLYSLLSFLYYRA